MLIDPERSQLLLVDVQEKLVPIVGDPAGVVKNVATLIRAAEMHAVPVLASEQYPKGLGHTVPEIAELLTQAPGEKTAFSVMADDALAARVRDTGRDAVILAGIEAHVCVLQTALDLLDQGMTVHVVADATGSRTEANQSLGLERLRQAGASIVSTEMVVFEFLRDAKANAFRELSKMIR